MLRSNLRSHDMCARYAGDEFVMVSTGCGRDQAESRARELQDAVAASTSTWPTTSGRLASARAWPCSPTTARRPTPCSRWPTAGCTRQGRSQAPDRPVAGDRARRRMSAMPRPVGGGCRGEPARERARAGRAGHRRRYRGRPSPATPPSVARRAARPRRRRRHASRAAAGDAAPRRGALEPRRRPLHDRAAGLDWRVRAVRRVGQARTAGRALLLLCDDSQDFRPACRADPGAGAESQLRARRNGVCPDPRYWGTGLLIETPGSPWISRSAARPSCASRHGRRSRTAAETA